MRSRPEVVADLLTQVLHVEVPRFTQARMNEATLNEAVPTEHYADAVVLLAIKDRPVLGVIVEAQLRCDNRKRYSWPQYAMNARARHKCPFIVVVVTQSPRVARWASQPIDVGNGTVFRQRIVGPGSIPKLTNARRAAREPELAVLAAIAHGREDTPTARRVVLATIAGLSKLPDDNQRMLYSYLVDGAVSAALRRALQMLPETQKFFSAAHRRAFTEGWNKGRTEGRVEGSAEIGAKAVLKILTKRRLPVTARQRRKIRECTELATLERWLDRAFSVASVDELLG